MENKRYTIREVMEMSVNDLGRIQVPIEMEEIYARIRSVRNNLIGCIVAIDEDEARQREEAAKQQEAVQQETDATTPDNPDEDTDGDPAT